MSALKEFANFITLNVANLAATYDRLLLENGENYQTLPADGRIAFARKLIKTVAEACASETSAPLCRLFEERVNQNPQELRNSELPQPLLEVECLGQTLTPVVPSLEAGKFFWHMLFEVRATVLRVGDRAPIPSPSPSPDGGERGVNKDITEHRQAEEVLRFQKALLEAQSEASIDGILVVSSERKFLSYNRRFVEMWQIPQQVIEARSSEAALQAVVDKLVDPQAFIAKVKYLYEHHDEESRDELVLKDGRVFDRYSAPIKSSEGVYYGRVWYFRDITEHKQTEERIRFLSHLVESSQVAQVSLNRDRKINYVNPFFCSLYGYKAEEVLSQPISILSGEDNPDEHYLHLFETIEHQEVWRGEDRRKRKDGSIFSASVSFSQIHNEEGQLIAYLDVSRDITGRKLAEEALHVSEERYRQAIIAAGAVPYYRDYHSNTYTFMGEGILQMTGYTVEEMTPQVWDSLEEEFHALSWIEMRRSVRAGELAEWKNDTGIRTRSGEFRWIHDSSVQVLDEHGKPSGSIGILQDVTERKQAEDALAKERNLLRTLIDNLPDHIYVKDAESRFIINNMAHVRALGATTPNEVVGKTDLDIFPKELAAQYYADERAIIQSGQPLFNREEPTIDQTTGDRKWVSTTKVPLRDSQGEIVGLVGLTRDITERKQAEEALQQSEERFRATFEQAAVGIAQIGLDRHWLWVNQKLCDIVAYTQEELLQKTSRDITYIEDSSLDPEYTRQLLAGELQTHSKDKRYIRKDGSLVWVNRTVSLVRDFSGEPQYFIVIIEDITQRKQLEQQLESLLARRAQQVQISTEVAQQISTATALDDLFRRVVNLVQAQFGYYHVQIYTLVEGDFVLQEGTGEAGRRMREAGHKIALTAEKSLVVRTLWSGEPVLVPNVSQEPTWLPNPLLPDTKAELAVPISLGAEVLGVLDVQSDTVGGLSEEDQLLLIGLCGQIAVAIENARLYQAIQQELAERTQMETALAAERNMLRTVIDNIPDSIYVKDTEGRHLIVNQAMQGPGTDTVEEILGKSDLDLYPPEEALQWYADDMAVIQSGQPVINREELSFEGDKHVGWDLTTKVPLYDSQGKVMGLVGVSRDITEQKRAEEKLIEERNLLRALMDNLPDYIYVKDAESRFLLANEAMRRHLGAATQDEVIGKTDFDFSPLELAEQYYADEQAFLQAGQPKIGYEEPMFDHETGTRKVVLSTKIPFRDSQGRIIGLVGLNRDITLQKQGEAERERLLAETKGRLQEIQALQQISQDLATTLQPKEILDIFFQACIQLIGFEYVQLSLVDKEQRRIKGIAGVGVTESNIKKANRHLDEPDLLADVIRSGQIEVLTGWDDRLDRAVFEAEGHANWVRVFIPIRLRQENIGVVEGGFNKNIRANITDSQLRLLQTFIDQTALALDNAQRYEASQKAATREKTIREITEKMRAATSLEQLVKTTARELGQRLSAGHTMVELGIDTHMEHSEQPQNGHEYRGEEE